MLPKLAVKDAAPQDNTVQPKVPVFHCDHNLYNSSLRHEPIAGTPNSLQTGGDPGASRLTESINMITLKATLKRDCSSSAQI